MYNRTQVKLAAKQALREKWGVSIGVIIVVGLILAVSAYVPFATILLTGIFSVGLAIVMLEIVRGWKVEFGDAFKGFNNFGTNCLAGVLVTVFTALWSMLFVIPGIVKTYSYAMTFYILADHPEMKPKDAITASRIMMDGHKFDLFVLELSFFWWHLLGGLTLGLAYLYIAPYMAAARAKFYDTIKDEKNLFPVAEETVEEETAE